MGIKLEQELQVYTTGAYKTSTRGVISAARINDLEFEILWGNIVFFHEVIEISPVFPG